MQKTNNKQKHQAKTILLTGGAGFIGSHAANHLLKRGDRVIIVDNINDYYDPQIKLNRIKKLKKEHKNLTVYKTDISKYKIIEQVFQNHHIDKVCNLAAQAGVRYSLTNPMAYINSNIVGFINMLELCRHYKINDFIFASSSSVYGGNKKQPFSEKDRVDCPISLYAASKKSNEEMAFAYHKLLGLTALV